MNNIILHKAPPGTPMITPGTEKFNAIFQQYPVKFLMSSNRKVKYITRKDVIKYDRFVDRKWDGINFPPFPKDYSDIVGLTWRPAGDVARLYVYNVPLVVNRITKGVDDGIYGWFPKKGISGGKKIETDTLAHTYEDDPRMVDRNKGADGWVMANPKAAGTERWQKINGQDIWNGSLLEHSRNKLKDFLMTWFVPKIVQQLPSGIWAPKGSFIHTEFIFYYPFQLLTHEDQAQDIDNHGYPYIKAFHDALVKLEVFKGDGPRHIRGYYPHYVEVATEEERRMEVKFHFCQNEETIVPRIYSHENPVLNRHNTSMPDETDPL